MKCDMRSWLTCSSASRDCLSAKGVGGVETADAVPGKIRDGPSSSGVIGGGIIVRSIRSGSNTTLLSDRFVFM